MTKLKLAPNEKILYVARIHWLVTTLDLIGHILAGLLPVIIVWIIPSDIIAQTGSQMQNVINLGLVGWVTLVWLHYFFNWTDYRLDIWIVTNERLIDIDQNGMFSRNISTLRMEQVQDISINTSGLVNTLLKLGDIHVQTAAEQREFIIKKVEDPLRIKNILSEVVRRNLD